MSIERIKKLTMDRILSEERDLARAQMADEIKSWVKQRWGERFYILREILAAVDQIASQGPVPCENTLLCPICGTDKGGHYGWCLDHKWR